MPKYKEEPPKEELKPNQKVFFLRNYNLKLPMLSLLRELKKILKLLIQEKSNYKYSYLKHRLRDASNYLNNSQADLIKPPREEIKKLKKLEKEKLPTGLIKFF